MKLFHSLKQEANSVLDSYKSKGPATYAAAQQAIGAILITDGFIGIESPFGQGNKRPGIFGTIIGMILGVVFMYIPTFFGSITGTDKMTSTTPATVVSVGPISQSSQDSSGTCTLTVSYSINGQQYTQPSSISSSGHCALTVGQTITVNYDPSNPGAWVYGAEQIDMFMRIFFWAGLLALLSSVFRFFIRLLSIIFGWKLLRAGRRNAKNLPPETNFKTMVDEIKKNFVSSIFGFGGNQSN
jgi:ABC-type multidrug transport system fused ATPase/permease subunit